MSTIRIIVALFLTFFLVTNSYSQSSAEESGLSIAKEAHNHDMNWQSSSMTITMILRNKHGQETVRKLRSQILEGADDGDRVLIVFDNPADVKGTASLIYSHKTGDDDQWLYLPALKQVKRISSSNKSGPFMGSEFAYEDLSSQEVEKYTYKYIGTSPMNGVSCFLVERYPVSRNSGYKRQQVWFNKDNYRIEKIDFYDRKDSLIKTLTYLGYNKYLDKYWRAAQMVMVNHQNGKQTEIRFEDYKFQTGLTEENFTLNSLQNVR